MSSTDLLPTRTGRCLYGAVLFTPADAPSGHGACLCGTCRRRRGRIEPGVITQCAAVTWRVTEHHRIHRSSDRAERGFCATCGANPYWKMTADGAQKGMKSLPAGAPDGLDGLTLTHEVYIDTKPAGHVLAGGRKRMTEAEVPAMAGAEPEGETP